jgi:hypothetical protein
LRACAFRFPLSIGCDASCWFVLSEAGRGDATASRTRALNLERCAGWTEEKHHAASAQHLQIESGACRERRVVAAHESALQLQQ